MAQAALTVQLPRLHVLCQGRSWLGGEELGRGKGLSWEPSLQLGARGQRHGDRRRRRGTGAVHPGGDRSDLWRSCRPTTQEASYACVSPSCNQLILSAWKQDLLQDKEEDELQKTNPEQNDSIDRLFKHITRNKHWSIITMSSKGMTESRSRKMYEILDTSCCYKVNPISASLSHFLISKPPTLHSTSSRTQV